MGREGGHLASVRGNRNRKIPDLRNDLGSPEAEQRLSDRRLGRLVHVVNAEVLSLALLVKLI